MSVITLLTDFGIRDEFVGVMKGVILSINPSAIVVDISHAVPPQDVHQAAYLLEGYHRYFPPGTVHVVVVDPGVGGPRSILAVKTKACTYLVPDNGVLERIAGELSPLVVVRVENSDIFLPDVSRTFHGRDIFAPVAARLAGGLDICRLGRTMAWQEIVRLDFPEVVTIGPGVFKGRVIAFDRFGNCVTDIRPDYLKQLMPQGDCDGIEVRLGRICITGLSLRYDAVAALTPLAIVGSRGYLEIGLNRGNAREALQIFVGDPVIVRYVLPGSFPCDS